ncbi:MAG: uncharacterized protein K0S37_2536 [Microbacterium sp.]|nr:uncharacterized protein [Microbacterium sp.]
MTDDERPGRRGGPSSVNGAPGSGPTPDGELAPVIPLFGRDRAPVAGASSHRGLSDSRPVAEAGRTREDHPAKGRATEVRPMDVRAREDSTEEDSAEEDDARERAEALLLRKLRSRSLSVSEARSALRAVPGAGEVVITELIDRFLDLGYLNDAVFAEQLVLSAVEKRGEGRRAVAQTLLKHGIPRDVADAALAEMPDDDAERALEYARSKARSVGGKDDDAALRRLAGQLARRGYPSSVALHAARQALREVGGGPLRPVRSLSGVRFTPDD